jgi:hypothetical protein
MKKFTFILTVVTILFFGCKKEEVESDPVLDPLSQYNWTISMAEPTTQRNIVIEEFSGAMCRFCPIGHRELKRLDSIYGSQVIPVSIHAGNFAQVQSDNTKPFHLDLRIPLDPGESISKGETYLNTFNPNRTYPRGIVSRLTEETQSPSRWQGVIDNVKNDPVKAIINLEVRYAENEELIHVLIDYAFTSSSANYYNLQVYAIENEIIGWQDDLGTRLEFYPHNYVLRKALNGTWGEFLFETTAGNSYRKEYVLNKEPHWNSNNVKIVAFIADATTKEIIQANQTSLK